MPVINELLPPLILNLIVIIVIVGFVYYPSNHSRREYVFTFFTFSILMFFISGLLRDVQLTLGFGFGLLAVFSVLRYRTERIPLKEMTYIFICITIPFMNTLFTATRITFQELAMINAIIVTGIFLAEKSWGVHYLSQKEIIYEKIDLIKPDNHEDLMHDLRTRTGLDIQRYEIEEINFLRDTANITIYYNEPKLPK